ncbi:MAG: GNAT family N-acetyltransferase [Actinomycetes bacterium]
MTDAWLPAGFDHPRRVELVDGVHLRPIRAEDVDIDMVTVMANRDMLWAMYGEAWEWPPADMTHEQDREDLARHAREMETHESFNYAVLTSAEDRLLGCVYIDPLPAGSDGRPAAEVSWWIATDAPEQWREALDAFVPRWIASAWPFGEVSTPFQHLRNGS